MKTSKYFISIYLGLLCSFFQQPELLSQPYFPANYPVYVDTIVATAQIFIHPDSLALIFHPDSAESDHEYPATFVFNNGAIHDTVENIGFRLRGNTSRYSQKKSFKISFNTFESGRKFYGFEKLNLNGEHNDPSIIRSKLSWDIFRKMRVPASRSGYVMLYINNIYYGLYINVEHIDENFVKSRFGNNDGNLYKCLWPADLQYLGNDPNLYKLTSGNRRVYDLKTNENTDDYTDLMNFISVLYITRDSVFIPAIQEIFNLNGFLKSLAVDVLTGSWDDYWFWKNNYYLYHNTETGKFEFIPYDFDNSFGIWWNGIMPGVDWGSRNIYNWGHPSEPRPLVNRILSIPEFKDRFSFYLNQTLNQIFNADSLNARIDEIHSMITYAAELDTIRTLDWGFTINDFHNSYTTALGGHVLYGLKPYITTRNLTANNQLILNNIAPIISEVSHEPRCPQVTDTIYFKAFVEDDGLNLSVELNYNVAGSWQTPLQMFDDGLHFDGESGDGLYGIYLTPFNQQTNLIYYIFAQDQTGLQSVSPPNAPQNNYSITIGYTNPKLFVNEFMAGNDATIADEFGEFDDWIEIYNGDTSDVWLGDKYLTDNLSNPDKWQFPDTTLQSGDFLLIWADDQGSQGPLHASFKLSKDGEEIGIFNNDSTGYAVIDTVTFGAQTDDISYGRITDGGENWTFFTTPTPGISNSANSVEEYFNIPEKFEVWQNYPNPFNSLTTFKYRMAKPGNVKIEIYDIAGQHIKTLVNETQKAGIHSILWDGTNLNTKAVSSGLYFYVVELDGNVTGKRMILLK